MGFVDDECVVLVKISVVPCFGEEDAIGHEFDSGMLIGLILKTNVNADFLSEFGMGFFGYTLCHAGGGESAGLSDANTFGTSKASLIDHFGKLGSFSGTSGAADNNDRVLLNGMNDFLMAF